MTDLFDPPPARPARRKRAAPVGPSPAAPPRGATQMAFTRPVDMPGWWCVRYEPLTGNPVGADGKLLLRYIYEPRRPKRAAA